MKNLLKYLRFNGLILVFVICLLFVFMSCGSSKYINFVEKFLSDFRERNMTQSYTYLTQNEEFSKFNDYMDIITNLENSQGDFRELSDLILKKIFDFEYEILDEEDGEEYVDVNVRIKYFDFSNVYKNALNDFLSKSLDFENLDELYSGDYIKNTLMNYIDKIPFVEEELKINVSKGKNLKINLNKDTIDVLTANFMDFFTSVNKNILGE